MEILTVQDDLSVMEILNRPTRFVGHGDLNNRKSDLQKVGQPFRVFFFSYELIQRDQGAPGSSVGRAPDS